MPIPDPFWKWLESRPNCAAVMAEWRGVADGMWSVVEPMLRPMAHSATSYPNPRPHGRPLKVVHHNDGSVVAVDEDDWQNRLELDPRDVILHQLDLRALRKAIRDALDGVKIARTSVASSATRIRIGNWEPKKAASFASYLLRCRNPGLLRKEVQNLILGYKKPGAILLTPTRANWGEDLDDTARDRKMLLVSLDEVLDAGESGFSETAAWEEYLQAFSQMVKLTLPSNYRNKRPIARRASLMANVEKIKKALVDHIRSARDGVVASIDAGSGARLVSSLKKTHLAKLADLKPYHITRCFDADPQLERLYQIANDPEEVLRFGK